MPRIAPLVSGLLAVGLVAPSGALAQPSVTSEHETVKLKKGRRAPDYARWTTGQSLELSVDGPTVVELRLRPVFATRGGELELEAVRDGTHSSVKTLTVKRVRAKFEDARIPPKDIKVHLEVGEGSHTYEISYSGEVEEVLVLVKQVRRAKSQLAFGPEEELPPPEEPDPPEPPPPPAEVAEAEPAEADVEVAEGTPAPNPGESTESIEDSESELAVVDSAEAEEDHGHDSVEGEPIPAPIAPPEPEPDEPPASVAVFQINGKAGFDQDRCDMFSEFLQHELRQRGHRVIGDSDISTMLGFESTKSKMDCSDASCIAELGGALGVDEIVTGAIATMGPYLMITLKRIDTRSAGVLAQAAYKLNDSVQGALADSILPIAKELYGARKGDAAGVAVAAVEVEASGAPGVVPITLWAVAGASLGAGLAFTMVAKGHADNANNPDFVGRQAEIGATETAQTISAVGYGVAGAAAVAGTLLWLLVGDDDSSSVAVVPSLRQQGGGVAAVVQF